MSIEDGSNSISRYMDEEEIVEDMLLYQLTEGDKQMFRQVEADELIGFHHSLGNAIRTYYRLWEEGNPFVGARGLHPDDVSQNVIENVWSKLTGKTVPKRPKIVDNGNGTYSIDDSISIIFTI